MELWELWVPEADLAFFTNAEARKTLPPARQGGFDLAARLIDICGAMLRPISVGTVAEDIEAIAVPGHTPGQMAYLIGRDDKRLTRLEALSAAADHGWLVSGGHLGGFFTVERRGDSFGFIPQPG